MLCSSKQFRLSTADAAKVAQLSVRPGKVTACGRKKTTSGAWKYFLLHVVGPLMMSCIGDTVVTNNKADAKSPPPVVNFVATRGKIF